MPITRTQIPDFPPDEFGNPAYHVQGDGDGNGYWTQGGDRLVEMFGGDDVVLVGSSYNRGISELQVSLGDGRDALIDINGWSGEGYDGGPGNDYITVTSGDDWSSAFGGAGDDTLISEGELVSLGGGDGDDRLFGSDSEYGVEWYSGGKGRDTIWLGDQGQPQDVLIYRADETGIPASATKPETRDLVFNFEPGEDIIDLSRIDANLNQSGDQAFAFVGKVASPTANIGVGRVGWYEDGEGTNGEPVITVAWNDGGGRESVQLYDTESVARTDFIL